jgi:hypothetical protein
MGIEVFVNEPLYFRTVSENGGDTNKKERTLQLEVEGE